MFKSSVLVSNVRDLLQDSAAITAFDIAFRPRGEMDTPEKEVIELNVFWREQLCKIKAQTISERECLVDDTPPDDWLRHFRTLVLPTIKRFQLPKH